MRNVREVKRLVGESRKKERKKRNDIYPSRMDKIGDTEMEEIGEEIEDSEAGENVEDSEAGENVEDAEDIVCIWEKCRRGKEEEEEIGILQHIFLIMI